MNERKTTFRSNGYTLTGTYVFPEGRPQGALLRLSGGANLGYSHNQWQARLAKAGVASFAFDFAGVDESEGALSDTNLNTRLADSREAFQKFRELLGDGMPITVLGVSMGAPIAIWLTGECEVAGLILAVAAAYPMSSHDKNFGEVFSREIRTEGAWRSSVEFTKLQALTVPILFISALKDDIIPREITQKYEAIVEQKDGKVFHFDVPHRFLRESYDEYTHERERFWSIVTEFTKT